MALESPKFGPFLSGTRFHDSTASGGVAVVFERDEGELDLVRGNEVFAEDGDTLERGKLADSDNAGRPEAEAAVFAAHVPRSSRMARTPEGVCDATPEPPPPESRTST